MLALLMIILVSLPLCCGILKQYGKARKPPGWKSSVFFCSFCPDVDFSLPSFIGASASLFAENGACHGTIWDLLCMRAC